MISHKEVLLGASARERIRTGVDLIGDAVRVTMGPRGRNVVLERKYALPAISNDGYTVANSINSLADPFVDTGAKLAYQAAKKTNEDAGDGTSTSAVLTQAMYAAALKLISAGYNPMILRRGMELAGAAVTEHLKGMARDLSGEEELTWVASLSANDPEIGKVIAGVYTKLGADAGVNLEDGSTSELTVDYLAGLTFDRGLKSPYFGSGEDIKAEIDQPNIFITDQKLEAATEIVPILEKFVSNGMRNLLVIAEDVEKEALAALVINKLRGNLNVAAVKAPAFGDRRRGMLEDYAIFTGGRLVAKELGIGWEDVTLDYLGRAEKAIVGRNECTIIGGSGEPRAIEQRVAELWASSHAAKNDFDREKFAERANNLAGTVAVLNIGAPTEVEQKETRARVEDAVAAAKAALQEGVIPGGGVSLVRAAAAIDALELTGDAAIGAQVVRAALSAPLAQIAENAGYEGDVIVRRVGDLDGAHGFNAATGEYEDLFETGIVDPVRVTRLAVTNAVSAAVMLVTTEAMVVDPPPKSD